METAQQGPHGVRGWLALLVAGLLVLGPLMTVGRTAGDIVHAEYLYPGLADVAEWSSYKTVAWIAVLVVSAISIYGGIGLATRRTPDAVSKAKIVLWLINPVAILVMGMLILIMFPVGVDEAVKVFLVFILSFIPAGIWTAYLNRSKRVKNTYGVGRTSLPGAASPKAADIPGPSKPRPASSLTSPPRTDATGSPTPATSNPENVPRESFAGR